MLLKRRTQEEAWYTNKLRKLWRESPMYYAALRAAKVETNAYRCAKCKAIFKLREIQVDHIDPVIDPAVGWVNVAEFAQRLNCPPEGLQSLCADVCHLGSGGKTQTENKERRDK